MEDFMDGLVPILGVICIFGLPVILGTYLVAKSISARREERMTLVRQGIIPPEKRKPTPNKYRSLRNGFLCIGIAIGLIVGIVIIETVLKDMDYDFLIPVACVMLFLGIAYVAFYTVVKDKSELDNDAE